MAFVQASAIRPGDSSTSVSNTGCGLICQDGDLRGVDDLRAMRSYQLDNARVDEDYEFMRP
ncbi:MAG: hypothetical protein VB948_09650 [Pseudomonadales bacterium]|jgi:hypothetical protein